MASQNETAPTGHLSPPTLVIDQSNPYLITGSSGFIGGRLTNILLNHGCQVIGIDKRVAKITNKNYRHYLFDLTGAEAELQLEEIFSSYNISWVVHLAALINVGDGEKYPKVYQRTNIGATVLLLGIMRKYKVKRLIFASSGAVYKTAQRSSKNHLKETDELSPVSIYGQTKLKGENLIQVASDDGLQAVIFRFFNVAGGMGIHQPPIHLIPIIIRRLASSQPIEIYGTDYPTHDGTCLRDYFHVSDLLEAILRALNRWNIISKKQGRRNSFPPLSPGNRKSNLSSSGSSKGWLRVYNLGLGRHHSVLEIYKSIVKHYNQKFDKDKKFTPFFADRRAGDPAILVADCQRAKNELNWQARRSLDDIIMDSLDELGLKRNKVKNES